MSEPELKVDDAIALYLTIREAVEVLDKRHEVAIAPYKQQMKKIEGLLQQHLDKTGADSVKTKNGTAILTTKRTVSIADKQMFKDYVIQSERWELLDWKANSTAAVDYAKENNTPPPGCNLSSYKTVGVRRATGVHG